MLMFKRRDDSIQFRASGERKEAITSGLKRILEQMQGVKLSGSWSGVSSGKPVGQEMEEVLGVGLKGKDTMETSGSYAPVRKSWCPFPFQFSLEQPGFLETEYK